MKVTNEIDIIAIISQMFRKPRVLAAYLAVAAVVGIIVALNTPKQYTSSVVLAPEMSSSMGLGSGLADMAADFGIDIKSSGKEMDAIYPEIYPELFTSYDFIHSLFDVPIRTVKNETARPYIQYLTKEVSIPFWMYPRIWLAKILRKKEDIAGGNGKADKFITSREESELCAGISSNITCLVDKKTSVITLSVKDEDALVCAIMADTIQQRLQTYITKYRTQKARNDYAYYNKLLAEAKVKYDKAQKTYASYCDANQDVLLESFKAKRDELENNMQTAFNNMSQLNTQVQTAEAKIQERTPAFTILSEAKMQHKATSMPRAFIVILWVFAGGFANLLWTLYSNRKRERKEMGKATETEKA